MTDSPPLLPSAAEIAELLGVPALTAVAFAPYDPSAELEAGESQGAYLAAQEKVYAGTGFQVWVVENFADTAVGTPGLFVTQAVFAYPNPADAERVFAEQGRQWRASSGRVLTVTAGNGTQYRHSYGPLTELARALAINRHQLDAPGWVSQRALAILGHCLIDIQITGSNVANPESALDLAAVIGNRIPAAAPQAAPQAAPPPPPPPPPAPPAPALDSLLLSVDRIAAIVGLTGLDPQQVATTLYHDGNAAPAGEPVGPYLIGQRDAYAETGWISARMQSVRQLVDGKADQKIFQGLVGYPSAAAAAAAFAEQARQWQASAGRTVTVTGSAESTYLCTFGELTNTGDALAMTRHYADGTGWTVQRALGQCGSTLVDVQVSGRWKDATVAADLLDALIAGIPGAPLRSPTRDLLAAAPAPAAAPVSAPAPAEPPLLPPQRVAAVTGLPELEVDWTGTALFDDSTTLAVGESIGAFAIGQKHAYAGSGWISARLQTLKHVVDGSTEAFAYQSVIGYLSPEAAAAAFAEQARQWRASAGRSIEVHRADSPYRCRYGAVYATDDTLAITRLEEGGNGWGVQRALAVVGNEIIDVQVSGRSPNPARAVDLLDAIVAGMPGGGSRPPTRDRLPAQPPSPVPLADLDALLPAPEPLAAVVGVPQLVQTNSYTSMYDDADLLESGVSAGAFGVAERAAYLGSGWLRTRIVRMVDDPANAAHRVVQAVVLLPSPEAATAVFAEQARQWQAAAGSTISVAQQNAPYRCVYGPLTDLGVAIAITRFTEGGGGWCVQRALTVRGNVVVDVQCASGRDGDIALRVAQAIADAVPATVRG